VAGVGEDRWRLPTPCEEFTVHDLMNHMVGWIQVFEAGCHGRTYEGDPAEYICGHDAAAEFAKAANSIVAGWEEHGFDRQVRISGGGMMPGAMVFNMTVMEYLAHGWDLASATGQVSPYAEAEATDVLNLAKVTLPPEYQGEGMAFGAIVPVSDRAPAINRLIAFLGRDPAWAESPAQ
jgi:uncharacterized protein (TIGR03086 family)